LLARALTARLRRSSSSVDFVQQAGLRPLRTRARPSSAALPSRRRYPSPVFGARRTAPLGVPGNERPRGVVASSRQMPREAPEIRLIRETLEGVLHPATASSVLFDALQEAGGVPGSPEDVQALVRGPLTRRLVERLGEETTQSLLDQLELMLRAIVAAPKVRKRPSRHEDATRSVELSSETLPVYVLASSRAFADKLAAALGPNIMSAVLVTDDAMLADRLETVAPAFVLLDASDFPAIDPGALATRLAGVATDVVKAVWGADLPYGMAALAAAQEQGLALTPFDRREGIEPLMDMIRSRRG